MQQEIEATYLDVSHDSLRQQLLARGAVCTEPQHTMRRTIYDYADLRLDQKAAWIRVRDEAGKITMAFKHRQSETIEGMHEVEFTVSDYQAACSFMESIGLVVKAKQESTREVWKLDDCEIMLDEWPWIPPYVEVEGPSEVSVKAVSTTLGLDFTGALFDSTDAVYQKYFDVSRTEISTVPLVFGPVPGWLESKRRAA